MLNEDMPLCEGPTTVGTHISGCVVAVQHLVACQIRLLCETFPTVCALMSLLAQLVFTLQVGSQVPVTKLPPVEAHSTELALEWFFSYVGLIRQADMVPLIRMVSQMKI